MALSTSAIINNLEGATGKLNSMSVMYTPMDTGEYTDFGGDSLSGIMVIAYEIVPFVLMMALFKIREPEEDTIELIMKRLGVQKSVIVMRDLVCSLVFSGFWCIITSFAFWGALLKD